jgi:hypothetical protein
MTDLTTRVTVLETQVKALEKYTGALQTIVLALAIEAEPTSSNKRILQRPDRKGSTTPTTRGIPKTSTNT